MEWAAFLNYLSTQSPEFIAGFAIGGLLAFVFAWLYLLPKLIKNAVAGLEHRVAGLVSTVESQTKHIEHLEAQISKLEEELRPYRQFAEGQLQKLIG